MIYIYNDFGGTHTTALAAAYHLNKLPKNRELTKEEILKVDYFNKLQTSDMGKLIFHGLDENGNPVYTMGHGISKVVTPALKNFALVLQERYQHHETIVFSNTSPTVPFAMTIGGLFSRRFKINFIGVPLLVLGAKQCCNNIIRLVENTKKIGISNKDAKSLTILDNKKYKDDN
ncbi:Protein of unknown function [Paenibacillus sp. yr247]|uniref:DUF3189 family protein n=1 Tax=Paenibacillus sp. yr247 TaxID=1761880 RepID=UPI00087FE3B3|nr:DUF3189 family protein [Paenibacillus sp. yr247]SDM92401.1 Protein of unknown function [Paenibacillus sp. yr247]